MTQGVPSWDKHDRELPLAVRCRTSIVKVCIHALTYKLDFVHIYGLGILVTWPKWKVPWVLLATVYFKSKPALFWRCYGSRIHPNILLGRYELSTSARAWQSMIGAMVTVLMQLWLSIWKSAAHAEISIKNAPSVKGLRFYTWLKVDNPSDDTTVAV